MFIVSQDGTKIINTDNIIEFFVTDSGLIYAAEVGENGGSYTIGETNNAKAAINQIASVLLENGERVSYMPEIEEIPDK